MHDSFRSDKDRRYNPKRTVAVHQRASFVATIVLDLKNWYYDLPKELSLEYNGVAQNEPAVYITHMLYHTATILLMKPSVLRTQDQGKIDDFAHIWIKLTS